MKSPSFWLKSQMSWSTSLAKMPWNPAEKMGKMDQELYVDGDHKKQAKDWVKLGKEYMASFHQPSNLNIIHTFVYHNRSRYPWNIRRHPDGWPCLMHRCCRRTSIAWHSNNQTWQAQKSLSGGFYGKIIQEFPLRCLSTGLYTTSWLGGSSKISINIGIE